MPAPVSFAITGTGDRRVSARTAASEPFARVCPSGLDGFLEIVQVESDRISLHHLHDLLEGRDLAHRDPGRLGHTRVELVHRDRAAVTAGPTGDHEGEAKRVTEEPCAHIDVLCLGRWERVVHAMHVLPTRTGPRLDVAVSGELEKLALAPGDLFGFRHVR
jgi:hypothetical protein